MTPVLFGDCFGWLHPAAGRRGVVMCAPYGHEALTTHRAWRAFAERLSGLGLPTLRFDYPGTGDSAGGEEDPGRPAAWIGGIRDAVAYLRATAGVETVTLVGLRLGGLLAVFAARDLDGVEALVLLAPAASGRAFVQELRAMALLTSWPEGAPSPVSAVGIDSAGFRLTSAAADDLQALDPALLEGLSVPRVLLIDGAAARRPSRLAERLRTFGARVTEEPFPDHPAVMASVQRRTSSFPSLDRVAAWVAGGPSGAHAARPVGDATTVAMGSESTGSETTSEAALTLPDAIERPVRFGPGVGLFGVLCEPDQPVAGRDRPAVLLLNSGATHHVGSGRMSVRLARRLAAGGYASFRMDLAGLGDSGGRGGRADNLIYCDDAVADVRSALDWMAGRGHDRAVLVGLCAGAAVALHTALADERVIGQALINPGRYVLGGGVTAEEVGGAGVRPAASYVRRLGEPSAWRAILRRDDKAVRVARGLSYRAAMRLRIRAGRIRALLTGRGYADDDAASWFLRLGLRGVRTLLAHSAGDVTLGEMEALFGVDGGPLRTMPNLRMERIAAADHSLMVRPARERFTELLEEHLAGIGGAGPVSGRDTARATRAAWLGVT